MRYSRTLTFFALASKASLASADKGVLVLLKNLTLKNFGEHLYNYTIIFFCALDSKRPLYLASVTLDLTDLCKMSEKLLPQITSKLADLCAPEHSSGNHALGYHAPFTEVEEGNCTTAQSALNFAPSEQFDEQALDLLAPHQFPPERPGLPEGHPDAVKPHPPDLPGPGLHGLPHRDCGGVLWRHHP